MLQGLSWGYSQAFTWAGGTASQLIHRLLAGAVSSTRASPEGCHAVASPKSGNEGESKSKTEASLSSGSYSQKWYIFTLHLTLQPWHRAWLPGGSNHWGPSGRLVPIAFIAICVYFKVSFTSLTFCGQTLGVEGSKCCEKRSNKSGERGMYISSKWKEVGMNPGQTCS